MLPKYIANPYPALLLVSLWTTGKHSNPSWRFMPSQTSCDGFTIYFLFNRTPVPWWWNGQEKKYSGLNLVLREFFFPPSAREKTPKLDFLKNKKTNNKTEQNSSWQHYFKHGSLGLVHGNMKVILSRNSPDSLKSMNIHCMIYSLVQQGTLAWQWGHRTTW